MRAILLFLILVVSSVSEAASSRGRFLSQQLAAASGPSYTNYDYLLFTGLTHFGNTSNFTSYATASYTPTNDANCILFAQVHMTHATAPVAPSSVTGNGLTWTKISDTNFNTLGAPTHNQSLWWAQGAGSAGVFRADFGATTATGCSIEVVQLENALLGAGAIIQTVVVGSNATANPKITFAATSMAGTNGMIKFIADSVSSAADSTAETGNRWQEYAEDNYATPANGSVCDYSLSVLPALTITSNIMTSRDWAGVLVEVTPKVFVTTTPTYTNYADILITGGTSNVVNTMLTPTIMTNWTFGSYNTYDAFQKSGVSTTPTNFLIGASNALAYMRNPVRVGPNAYYDSTSNSMSMAYSNINNFHEGQMSLSTPGANLVLTVGSWVTFGPTNADVGLGQLFDYFKMRGNISGEFCVMQLQNGIGATNGYCINIESNPGGSTTHSSYMGLVPTKTYWCVLQGDFMTGTGKLNVYSNDAALTLVGAITTSISKTATSGDTDITPFNWGNGEIGLSTGISQFQNMVIDFRSQRFPIRP